MRKARRAFGKERRDSGKKRRNPRKARRGSGKGRGDPGKKGRFSPKERRSSSECQKSPVLAKNPRFSQEIAAFATHAAAAAVGRSLLCNSYMGQCKLGLALPRFGTETPFYLPSGRGTTSLPLSAKAKPGTGLSVTRALRSARRTSPTRNEFLGNPRRSGSKPGTCNRDRARYGR